MSEANLRYWPHVFSTSRIQRPLPSILTTPPRLFWIDDDRRQETLFMRAWLRFWRAPLLRLLLLVTRVIRRIDVFDDPGTVAVNLDDGFALGPGEVFHAGRPGAEGAS